jgi:hypothetical protein
MMQQLMWTEVLLKGTIGVIFALAPGLAASMLGMPGTGTGFWPRLTGALLLGIAIAVLIQGIYPGVRTIAPAGLIAINLSGAAMLAALLVLRRAAATRRGVVLLWVIAVNLVLLSLFEIAYV